MVECDVRQAADGALVLAHDDMVVASDQRRYVIAEHTSIELGRLDLGMEEGVPTLDELVAWACGRCGVMADMKCEGGDVEERVVAALAPLPIADKVAPGAEDTSRSRFRELDPTLPLALTLNTSHQALFTPDKFEALLDSIETPAVTWQHPLLTASCIAALHRHGKTVYAWTVDDIPTMRRLLEDGIDGLITNRPDLALSL